MPSYSMNELSTFAVVARERSFTKAAAQLGVSASALSQSIRHLEETLGLRLLTRTTRSVSVTEAGQRLLDTVGPRFDDIHAELTQLSALRDRPAGSVRITASEYAAEQVVWPRLVPVLRDYPEINLELSIDHGFRDIAAEGYDAGVRLGESVPARRPHPVLPNRDSRRSRWPVLQHSRDAGDRCANRGDVDQPKDAHQGKATKRSSEWI